MPLRGLLVWGGIQWRADCATAYFQIHVKMQVCRRCRQIFESSAVTELPILRQLSQDLRAIECRPRVSACGERTDGRGRPTNVRASPSSSSSRCIFKKEKLVKNRPGQKIIPKLEERRVLLVPMRPKRCTKLHTVTTWRRQDTSKERNDLMENRRI